MSLPNVSCACMGRGWFTLDMMGEGYSACTECNTHEIWHGMPRLKQPMFEVKNEASADTTVPDVYGPARDFVAADMARRQAELLSKYAAGLEAQINKSGHKNCSSCIDLQSRATLAREMSVVYFRAAELEKSS